jgi:hypothetical protein
MLVFIVHVHCYQAFLFENLMADIGFDVLQNGDIVAVHFLSFLLHDGT